MKGSRRTWLSLVYIVVVVVATIVALRNEVSEVSAELRRVSLGALAASLALSLGALGLSMLAWRELLIGLGHRVRVEATTQVFFLSQIGKYLPGSVWPAVAQVEFGRDQGIPRRPNAWSFAMAMILSLLSGVLVGGVATMLLGTVVLPAVGIVVAVVGGGVLQRFHRPVLARFPRLERFLPDQWPPLSSIVRAIALFSAHWVLQGLHLAVLLRALDIDGTNLTLSAIAAFPIAFVAGTLFIIAPAGLGIREGVLISLLGPLGASDAAATAASLVSRSVLTVADLLAAGLALLLLLRRSRRQANSSSPS